MFNISKKEIECKCGCGKNDINPKIISAWQRVADVISYRIGKKCTLIITSGLRCKAHNKAVGGNINSKHVLGDAIDGFIKDVSVELLSNTAKCILDDDFDVVKYDTFVHIEYDV